MNNADWQKLRKSAMKIAADEYLVEASSIIRLTKNEILSIIDEANVDNDKFTELISIVNDTTKTNNEKAEAIRNIAGLAEISASLIKTLL